YTVQLRQSKRSLQICKLEIKSKLSPSVRKDIHDAVIANQLKLLVNLAIASDRDTALARGYDFRNAQRETPHVGLGPEESGTISRKHRLTCIFDDEEIELLGQLSDLVHVDRPTVQMHRDYGLCLRGDSLSNESRVQNRNSRAHV